MTEKKIAFTCGWGQNPQELLDKYKLISPNRSGEWNYLKGVSNLADSDVVFMFDGMSDCDIPYVDILKTKKLFVIRTEPPIVCEDPVRMHPSLVNNLTVVDYTTQPIWYFAKWWEMSKKYSHEDFLNMPYSKKNKKLSCLISGRKDGYGHRSRLQFVNKLVQTNPDLLTVYGRNNGIPTSKGELSHGEKYLAYKDSEYSLCFENCSIPNYLTDKMFDATLMWSMPIYFGATNVADYLPQDSYYSLSKDLNEIDLEMVKNVCSQPPTKKNIKAIEEARYLILNKHSLWSCLQHVIENY